MKSLVKQANVIFHNSSIKWLFNKHLTNGVSVFHYGNYTIYISHNKNEYLRLSSTDEKMLDILIPLGDEVMKSKIIAEYLMESDNFEKVIPTVEWNRNKSMRQKELENGVNLGFKCHNLKLYDDCEIIEKGNVKKLKMTLFR